MLTESVIKRLQKLANIKEQKEGSIELYHVTITGPKPEFPVLNSLKKGISIKRSVGMAASQGAGFYVFKKKETALKRASSSMFVSTGDGYRAFREEEDGNRLLVTLKFDTLDPRHFDLDAELSGDVILQFIHKNIERIKDLDFGVVGSRKKKIGVVLNDYGSLAFTLPDPDSNVGFKTRAIHPNTQASEIMKPQADWIGTFVNLIEERYPNIFHELEQQMLYDDKTDAIKYDGEETIRPYKLEVIKDDNSLLDVTNNDPK